MPPKVNKVEVELKKLTKLDGNKICANCPEKMPGYAEMTHCIFICTKCAGVHREFQYKVKGISMSTFTEEDVLQLSRVGNESHNAVYMAKFVPREYPIPNGADTVKLKEFIKMKYVDRRWYEANISMLSAENTISPTNSIPKPVGTSQIVPPAKRNPSLTVKAEPSPPSLDLLSLSDPVSPPKHSAEKVFSRNPSIQLPANNSDPFGSQQPAAANFDPFGSQPTATAVSTTNGSTFDPFDTHSSSSNSNGSHNPAGFDAFNSTPNTASHFNAFPTYPAAHPTPTIMPYIKIAPPQAPTAPVESDSKAISQAAATGPSSGQAKNFSVFDDLFQADSNAGSNAANPFANPSNFGAAPPQQQPAQQQPLYAQHPPQHQQPQFPPQQGYPAPYPASYPAPYGYPPAYGYPPQAPSQPYPAAYPAPPAAYPNAPYPNPNYGYPAPTAQAPVPVPAAPAAPQAPDPFEHMSGLAWSALGSKAPPASHSQPQHHQPPPQQHQPPPQQHQPPPQQQQASSVNPFDMF
mmetsp:Transcript_7951/g.11017  ORF Transcript_7951/g.11017 Transcript_7951/m.11017 type:complete len:519 (+) Transcript_7951:50-1606(+)